MKYLTKHGEPKINGVQKRIGLFFAGGFVVFFENERNKPLHEKVLEAGAAIVGAGTGLVGLPVFLAGWAVASMIEPKKKELGEALQKAKKEFNLTDEAFFIASNEELEVTISGKRILSIGMTLLEVKGKFMHSEGADEFQIEFEFDESKSTIRKIFKKAGIECKVL